MDAFLPAMVAALLAETGDKTQLMALLLAARFGRCAPVLAGIAVAALANAALASVAGGILSELINFRAVAFLLGIALLLAGAGMLLRQLPPVLSVPAWMGAFAASSFAFFVLEFGDKTQLLTTAFAARAHSVPLTAVGAALGVVVANVAAIQLGELYRELPVKPLRRAIAALFLVAGAWVGLEALRII